MILILTWCFSYLNSYLVFSFAIFVCFTSVHKMWVKLDLHCWVFQVLKFLNFCLVNAHSEIMGGVPPHHFLSLAVNKSQGHSYKSAQHSDRIKMGWLKILNYTAPQLSIYSYLLGVWSCQKKVWIAVIIYYRHDGFYYVSYSLVYSFIWWKTIYDAFFRGGNCFCFHFRFPTNLMQ